MLKQSRILNKVKIGMTRQEVFNLLGKPTNNVIGSRKYPRPIMYLYGNLQFTFSYPENGGLISVTKKDQHGIPVTLIGPPDSTEDKLIQLAKGKNPVNKFCRINMKYPSSNNVTVVEGKITNPRGYWIDIDPKFGEGILFVLDIREIEILDETRETFEKAD